MSTSQCNDSGRLPGAVKALVALLLATQSALLAWSATRNSPTLDEPAHLVAGLRDWDHWQFDLYRVNPPLVRMIAAWPIRAVGAETDWSELEGAVSERPEFAVGADFVKVNGVRSLWLFSLARWACIPFSLLGGWTCFRWSRDLFGSSAGLLSLVIWTFSPSILAHGQLITTDVAAASLGVAAGYSFWRWLKAATWQTAGVAGIVLGLAELAKMTWLMLFALWPLMWLGWVLSGRGQPASGRPRLDQLALVLITGLYVLNLGYAFNGSFSRLNSYAFVSQTLSGLNDESGPQIKGERGNRFAGLWIGKLPVPLPRQYVLGFDQQKYDLDEPALPSYLAGETRDRGWWYFYLFALALKVPLGTVLLAAVTLGWRIMSRRRPLVLRDECILLAPMIVELIVVSSQTGASHHLRYALPVLPFAFVWLGQSVVLAGGGRMRTIVVGALVLWSVVSSLWAFPHSLSYFNEFCGGPVGGPRYLINSDCDWGQDLLELKDWLAEHGEDQTLYLAYYGNVDPRDFGISYQLPPFDDFPPGSGAIAKSRPSGLYAVSVNFLYGLPHKAPDGNGDWKAVPQDALKSLSGLRPVGRAGYSIYLYRIETEGS